MDELAEIIDRDCISESIPRLREMINDNLINDEKCIELKERRNINAFNNEFKLEKLSILEYCAYRRSLNSLIFFIKFGLNPRLKGNGLDLAHFACIGDAPEILSYLISELGFRLNSKLYFFLAFNSKECIDILLMNHVPFDLECLCRLIGGFRAYQDNYDRQLKVFESLLNSCNLDNESRYKLLEQVCTHFNYDLFNIIVNCLVPFKRNKSLDRSIDILCRDGRGDIVKKLFDRGISLSHLDVNPLYGAVSSGDYDLVSFLLWKGADLYGDNDKPGPPVFNVRQSKNEILVTSIIDMFIRHGYNINYKKGGISLPMLLLSSHKSPLIIKYLFERGAVVDGSFDAKLEKTLKGELLEVYKQNRKVSI